MACIFALSKRNVEFDAFSLDINQTEVVNHNTGEVMNEKRNMIIESSRITRAAVKCIKELKVKSYSGLVFPGGFGVAKNLCDFAYKGKDFTVSLELANAIKEFHSNRLPIASCCISPLLLAKILGSKSGGPGIKLTLGDSSPTEIWPSSPCISLASDLGNLPEFADPCVDNKNRVVTTYAYMKSTAKPHEVFEGIDKMIEEFVKLI